MDTVIITVCLGTTCHLMGAAHLQSLPEQLPPNLRDHVAVKWVRCMNLCQDSAAGNAPFVLVNEEVVNEATLPKIIDKVEALVGTPR